MADYTFRHINTRDEAVPEVGGTVKRVKRVEFMLGQHGPFTERVTEEELHAGEIDVRVAKLRQTLTRMETL